MRLLEDPRKSNDIFTKNKVHPVFPGRTFPLKKKAPPSRRTPRDVKGRESSLKSPAPKFPEDQKNGRVTTFGLFPTLDHLDFWITSGEPLQLAGVGLTGLDR